jgi:hypothetical protein
MRSFNCWVAALLSVSLAACSGCGSKGTDATLKVTGTVTYNGAPVADASVTFTPEKGRPATGITDAAGKFTLTTFSKDDGAVPGRHKVTIAPNASKIEPMPGTPEAATAAAGKPPFPRRYSKLEESGLSAEVRTDDKNVFPFNMTD